MSRRLPDWLKVKTKDTKNYNFVYGMLNRLNLNTVCDEANCPNRGECYSAKTATFMILGSVCTRNCSFCNVYKGIPTELDNKEPKNIAKGCMELGLKHVVITSVTRDDLIDGGSGHFVKVIQEIRKLESDIVIEVLIPDFKGDMEALKKVVLAKPDIINHNMETISSLYDKVRPMANYENSLNLLKEVKRLDGNIYTKSGIMVGLGEKYHEVIELFKDLRKVSCDFLTIGQYLAPSKEHIEIKEFVHPDIFTQYKKDALDLGFLEVASGPLVRSSYHAREMLEKGEKND